MGCIFVMPQLEVHTVKCITSHTGYHSCERCRVKGQFDEHVRHVCFLDVDCCLRTDLDVVQQTDKGHHTGFSFLVAKIVCAVSGFVLDYVHLCCLGITKQLLER